MASLKGVITAAYDEGRYTYTTFRKVSGSASSSAYWFDLSIASGNPRPNYYIGDQLASTVPVDWYKNGLWHGGSVAPLTKRLHKVSMLGTSASSSPAVYLLCDYLLYYPLVDMDVTEQQDLTNTVTLPRYTDGVGVKAFLVATNPYVGGSMCQIVYTNSNGVGERRSGVFTTNAAVYIGSIVNSHASGATAFGAFIPMQAGDIGIRSIQSITFASPNGGLAALVLCKPIATLMTKELTAFAEFDFISMKPSMPVIQDGAYLNWLILPSGSVAAVPIIGELTTIWG